MTITYRPFSCGAQAEDWMASNCDRCTKQRDERSGFACPVQEALIAAWYGGGDVSHDVAYRMGYLDDHGKSNRNYLWPCREVRWCAEWIAEWHRLHAERRP